ncbi:MAG TPA: CarD family transcriptional regulator, partial [Candidatus Aminicenantes bacterium]|nr:CarD family transcriptional regulator [Candidatus Aminicenantes bacterium]
ERWLEELTPGDPVVHAVHGIGRFAGFAAMTVEGRFAEYLKIEYLNREYLYVPVYELDSLHRYNAPGGGEAPPACDRLGGKSWRQKRDRARKALVHFARELLELYARRKSVPGTSYPRVDEWERTLEESFPYPETPDQRQAIARVLDDLEAPCPMDRLVCGDVSFGKTEVAVRAAARVLAAGRQVALLCPTTILALQHFQTLQKRFAGLPVTVRMLSRLVGAGEKAATLKGLRTGGVDLVVGTHALLGTAVEFRDLGLYLIDEEQRFGVFQKERIKQGREHVDVLTLTATPIPRTLSLALAELQDVSLIRTPPLGRRAIRNYVGTLSREVVTPAIQHELERGGQVFLIYNRIDTIFSFRDRVAEWLPGVPMAVIHAQMSPAVIEKTLLAFIAGRYRVLISTTLIENGIDIPGVNTLIVAAADRFGLTQLYQLRGRIGRGDRQAHAYFLVEPGKVPSEIAQKRLDAIREFTELGAGFRLAEFDLQLRGAGSLLGARQHGHIEALGFDYYLDLLKQAIHELQGRAGEEIPAAVTVRFA